MTQQNAEEQPGIAAAIVVSEGRVLMVRRRVSEGQLRGSSRPAKLSRARAAKTPPYERPTRRPGWRWPP